MEEVLKQIEKKCKSMVCVSRKTRQNKKPVVGFPRADRLGQVLSLDLKLRHKKKPILYMIDCYSRLTLGQIIPNKTCEAVSLAVMRRWVGGGYPAPATFHSDCGGEFTGKELINLAENFNASVTTTAAYSPFQNGLNERGHSVVDRMMEIMMEDHKELDEEMALYWACYAKNSLQILVASVASSWSLEPTRHFRPTSTTNQRL